MKRTESAIRGAVYGGLQQPRDVIAALYAKLLGGVPFEEALAEAKAESLNGRQGEAQKENPDSFGAGQVGGNIAMSLLPAGLATKAIGAAAPILENAPIIGKLLSSAASKVGSGVGILGKVGQGAVQGAVSTGMTDGDLATGAGGGALGGAVFGLGGKLIKPVAKGAGSAAKQGYAKILEKAGINDLTIGQKGGNKTFENIDAALSSLPFTAGPARDQAEGQLKKFTQEAMRKAGIIAEDFSPQVRETEENGFKQRFGDLVKNETVKIDDEALEKLTEIETKTLNKLPTNVRPIVESYLNDIIDTGGKLTGEAYQAARSSLSAQARSLQNTDSFTAKALRDLRNTLDDAADRSLPEEKKGAWKELNNYYRNYKVLQKAASSPSRDSLENLISPSALLREVESANKGKSQAGYGDLYELARAGRSSLVDNVPNSGTAQRAMWQNILQTGGMGVGGGATLGLGTLGATGDPDAAGKAALVGAGLGVAGPVTAQKFLNSGAAKQYFTEGIPGLNKLVGNTGALGAVSAAQLNKEPEQPQEAPQYDPDQDPELQQMLQPQEPYNPENDQELQKLLAPEKGADASDYLQKVAMVESGGNPNAKAKTSSASGAYQFTDPTWKSMVEKHPEKGFTVADKNNPTAQQVMAQLLADENGDYLSKKGFEDNNTNRYLAHFLGAGGAGKVLSNPNSPASQLLPKAAMANKNIFFNNNRPRTGLELQQLLAQKLMRA